MAVRTTISSTKIRMDINITSNGEDHYKGDNFFRFIISYTNSSGTSECVVGGETHVDWKHVDMDNLINKHDLQSDIKKDSPLDVIWYAHPDELAGPFTDDSYDFDSTILEFEPNFAGEYKIKLFEVPPLNDPSGAETKEMIDKIDYIKGHGELLSVRIYEVIDEVEIGGLETSDLLDFVKNLLTLYTLGEIGKNAINKIQENIKKRDDADKIHKQTKIDEYTFE